MYLKTKNNSNLKTNEEKQNYKYGENYSISSLSKNIPFNPQRKNHSFQNSKIKKKKSNIISQIKNEENDNKIRKKLQYCKTDKELNIQTKSEKKEINIDNYEKDDVNKKITKNNDIRKSYSQKDIDVREECKTTDKNSNKTNKIFTEDISTKDNCFNIDNPQKEKNKNNSNSINIIKKIELPLSDKNEEKNKEIMAFKPNMNIFKNTKFNNFTNMSGKKDNKDKENIKNINFKNNKNYIIEKIYINKKEKEDKKNNKSENDKNYNDKFNHIEKDNTDYNNNYINNNRPLNMVEINKHHINSELAQFTFKNEVLIKDNNQNSSLITKKRKNELNKLINFTNKF